MAPASDSDGEMIQKDSSTLPIQVCLLLDQCHTTKEQQPLHDELKRTMPERKQCRLWWPELLLSCEPSSGFLLFGWCMNATAKSESVDVVVAAAVSYLDLSANYQQFELQEILRYANGKMPLCLQDSSVFTIIGHCFASCGREGFGRDECSHEVWAPKRRGKQQQYLGTSATSKTTMSHCATEQSSQESPLEPRSSEYCGCQKLDQVVEIHRQSSIKCGSWIQLISITQRIMNKDNKWIPKLHHMHLSGDVLPICDVHIIIYKPPVYGSHHFSLNYWDCPKKARTPFRKPHWVEKLHRKPMFPEMDTVVLALNCTTAANIYSQRCLSIKNPLVQFQSMLLSLIWHSVAVFIALISTIMYIILQLSHGLLINEPRRFLLRILQQVFSHTSKNLQIRSCQFLYWPILLQHHSFSSSNIDYLHRAALQKHFTWSNAVIDILLGIIVGVTLLSNIEAISLWITLIARKLTDDLLRSGFVWLMGVPAGFKLNTEFAELLGMVSLNAVQVFSTLSLFTASFLKCYIKGLSLLGIFFGVTVPSALCIDTLKLATLHVLILHRFISILYRQQIKALAFMWRLFRGRKWNPLRQRLDSFDYTVEQHIVGSLLFTPLLLLLPTTSVFHIFISMLSSSISVACIVMEMMISILHATPYFEVLLWIVKRRRFSSGLWFQITPQSLVHISASQILDDEVHSLSNLEPWTTFPETNKEPEYVVSFLHSNYATIGQVLAPFYKKVFQGFSQFSSMSPPYGILMGKRIPSSLGIQLPPSIPWVHINSKEYWKLCYDSVLSCRTE